MHNLSFLKVRKDSEPRTRSCQFERFFAFWMTLFFFCGALAAQCEGKKSDGIILASVVVSLAEVKDTGDLLKKSCFKR